MGNGKICASVSAETAGEFVSLALEASRDFSFVELRFDALAPDQLSTAIEKLSSTKPGLDATIVGTFRSSENGQGGFRDIPVSERTAFWMNESVRLVVDWADVEADIPAACLLADGDPAFEQVIRSHHDFAKIPDGIEIREITSSLLSAGPVSPIIKIACTPEDSADAISIFDLILDDASVIAIAMGEFGMWTRVLGPAFGSPLAYASVAPGSATAPGQISGEEMASLYRVESLSRQTAVYGILGRSAIHSMSPYLHNPAFAEVELDAVYLPLPARDAERFFKEMVSPRTRKLRWNLRGLSVTHPHKEAVAGLVDELSGSAAEIGAVNTVKVEEGKTIGLNTDADGFLAPLQRYLPEIGDMGFGIIGTGGAAKAAAFALKRLGADVTFFSRDPSSARISDERFGAGLRQLEDGYADLAGIDVLVNASPVGMRGRLEGTSPVKASLLQNLHLVYDMVYNPESTRFLRDASEAGVRSIGGLEMLVEQAAMQFEIWTGKKAPKDIMTSSARRKLRSYGTR